MRLGRDHTASTARRATHRPHRRRRAFTLVEALAALIVMAIVLPVAMNGLSLALRLGQDARLRGQAATLASGKLEELAATGQWQTGPFSGEFTNDPAATGSSATAGGTVFRWSAVVAPWSVSTMNELTVEVTWTAARHEHSVVVTTLVDPSSSTATGL